MSDYELKRINALTEASAINDSDVFAIDSAAGTKKVAWETLKGEVDADISEAVSNKADADGTYPDMAVGSVLGTNTVTDAEPYFLRPSASIGDREFDTLVGGTLGWNQLSQAGESRTERGLTITNNNDGSVTLNGTASEAGILTMNTRVSVTDGHVYAILANADYFTNGHSLYTDIGSSAAMFTNGIRKATSTTTNAYATGRTASGEVFNNQRLTLMTIDLTTLFGATIADYIYSLETATAGAGVAWVRKYLPNDYYAYCAPTLKHVSGVSAHVMRDANNNIIGNYPIDSTWTGMGVPKLDSANKLYFDGDTYASDGTVTERFNPTDLGALNWDKVSTGESPFFQASLSVAYKYVSAQNNFICAKYIKASIGGSGNTVGIFMTDNNYIRIRDNTYADAATFKTAMSGVYLVYEKATPTTSSASPFTSPQICDKDGTEEYVTTGLVPVGHETEYVENLADKLTDIPNLPTTAGNYHLAVTVDGGVPSYSWVSA